MSDDLFPVEESLSPRLRWLREMKEQHRIFTHYSEDCGWLAIPMDIACERLKYHKLTAAEKADGADLMAGYCRLLDDMGIIADNEPSEDEAIAALAKVNGWPLWNES